MVHWKNAAKKFVVSSMVLGAALLLNACGGGDSGSSSVGSGSSGGGPVGSGGGSGGSGGGSGSSGGGSVGSGGGSVGSGGGSGSPGGGSGGSGGGSVGSGGVTPATYLVYKVEEGGLYLVDPENLALPPQRITTNPVNILHEEHAVSSFNPDTKEYEGLHVRAIYYVDGDKGPLMRLSLVKKDGSTPQPVQVSDLNYVCRVEEPEGLVGTRVMKVWTAETGSCSTQYIVKFDDKKSTFDKINITGKNVVTFVVGNDLQVKGAIIQDSNSNILEFCDIDNLSKCNQLPSSVTYVYKIASNTQTQKEYLCVDGKIQIFYLPQSTTNPTLTPTNTDCKNGVGYDDKYIYSVNNGNIERLDMNKVEEGWKPLYNSGDTNNFINIIGMTQRYLIASVTNSSTSKTQVLAIKKEDGSYKTLISDGNVEPYYNFITPQRFYFTKNTSGTYKACYWDDELATPFCDADDGTIWIGLSYNNVKGTLDYSTYASPTLSLLNYPPYYPTVYKLLKVKESTGKLYAVDYSEPSSETELGDISSNFDGVFGGGIGDNILLLGLEITNKSQFDILFANLSKNILQRITKTPDKNEIPSNINIKNLF